MWPLKSHEHDQKWNQWIAFIYLGIYKYLIIKEERLSNVILIQLEYLYAYIYVYICISSSWNADRALVLLWKLGAIDSICELAFRWLGNWNDATDRLCTNTQHKSIKLLIFLVGCSVNKFFRSVVVWKSSCTDFTAWVAADASLA